MSEFDQAEAVPAEPQKYETVRVLSVTVELDDEADAGEIIKAVSNLGTKVRAVNLNEQSTRYLDYF